MFCTNCGSKNQATASECAQCGFKLGSLPAQPGQVSKSQKPLSGSSESSSDNLAFQGTMMGVAPPEMQAEIDKIRAARAAITKTAAHTPVAKAEATSQASSSQTAALKGTMMGVAPPEMQAEIAKIQAARAAEAQTVKQPAVAEVTAQPSAPASAPAANIAAPFKGTMMGLAPPELQTKIDRVKAARELAGTTSA